MKYTIRYYFSSSLNGWQKQKSSRLDTLPLNHITPPPFNSLEPNIQSQNETLFEKWEKLGTLSDIDISAAASRIETGPARMSLEKTQEKYKVKGGS